ncbi:MAG: ATP-binding protein [Planctomycetota bacterium]|jgi:cyanophycin synthetase
MEPRQLELVDLRLLVGANRFAEDSVAVLEVALRPGATDRLASSLGGVLERLRSRYPALELDASAGALNGDLLVGRVLGAIAERLVDVFHKGGFRGIEPRWITPGERLLCGVRFHEARVALRLGLAVELLDDALRDGPGSSGCKVALDEFVRHARVQTPGVNSLIALRAAERRGIPWSRIRFGQSFLLTQMGWGVWQRRFCASRGPATAYTACKLSHDKRATIRALKAIGLPVPDQRLAKDGPGAWKAARAIGLPVVVKPLDSSGGRGITVGIDTEAEVLAAAKFARRYSKQIVVESMLEGEDHRFLVIGGRVRAVIHRVPGQVRGDGKSTVRELLEALNQDPRRGDADQPRYMHRIPFDDEVRRMLALQSLPFDAVPEAGRRVLLRSVSNLHAGGTVVDYTEVAHPDNVALAERAARQIGLDMAGVDLLITDVSRSWREIGGGICEVNDFPGLDAHMVAEGCELRDYGGMILDEVFPPDDDARIPVIGLIGSGAERAAAVIGERFQRGSVGLVHVDAQGGFLRGARLFPPTRAVPEDVQRVLCDPAAEVAMVSHRAQTVLEQGLGYDRGSVAVLVGMPKRAVDAEAVSVLAAASRHVLVNADDSDLLASRLWGRAEPIFVSAQAGADPTFLQRLQHILSDPRLTIPSGLEPAERCGLLAWALAEAERRQRTERWARFRPGGVIPL